MNSKALATVAATALLTTGCVSVPRYENQTHHSPGQETAIEQQHNIDLIGNFAEEQTESVVKNMERVLSAYPAAKLDKELVVANAGCFGEYDYDGFTSPRNQVPLEKIAELVKNGTICDYISDLMLFDEESEPVRDTIVLSEQPIKEFTPYQLIDESWSGNFLHEYGHLVNLDLDLDKARASIVRATLEATLGLSQTGMSHEDHLLAYGFIPGFISSYALQGWAKEPHKSRHLLQQMSEYRKEAKFLESIGADSTESNNLRRFFQRQYNKFVTHEEVAELFTYLVQHGTGHNDPLVQEKLEALDADLRKPLK